MTKLSRFLLAAAIISAAAVAAAIHPQWGRSVGLALLFLLLAALVAAGILAFQSRGSQQRSAGKNLSPSLATLSSAAILAVYAAGYHRTSAGAGGFREASNRRNGPVVIASNALASSSTQPQIAPAMEDPHTATAATGSGKRQATSHRNKGALGSTNATPPSSESPVAYATAAPVAPRVAPSADTTSPSAAAPQIGMAAADPTVQLAASIAPAAPQPKALYKDGTYYGWGSCRHGDIQASVTIQEGKIASAAITQCLTRYSCSWISDLPNQVVNRQSPEVDYVSGASQSTDAFYGAIVAALSKARN